MLAIGALAGSADYTQNGANWHDICEYGREQSPIDLSVKGATVSDKMELMGFNYYDFKQNSKFSAADPTLTTYFDSEPMRTNAELAITFPDGSQSYFTPLQFHFHAPSEHTVDGKYYDAEVHFVHTIKGSGSVNGVAQAEIPGAVLGIFFDVKEGGKAPNAFLDSLFNSIDTRGTASASNVDIRKFLAAVDMTEYWSYDGSFTTPPCTEGIKWSVIKQVQSISPEQLARFTSRMAGNNAYAGGKGNNRVIMPLNERVLSYSGSASLVTSMALAVATVTALAF